MSGAAKIAARTEFRIFQKMFPRETVLSGSHPKPYKSTYVLWLAVCEIAQDIGTIGKVEPTLWAKYNLKFQLERFKGAPASKDEIIADIQRVTEEAGTKIVTQRLYRLRKI
jgi:hypothetical protein